jgi:DNA sulfur modification protein DndD
MLIEHIRLVDWRSFCGVNNFVVSIDREKNVTLIRAENGVGKTSLLAAVNWCLFDILPSDGEFENPSKLVNSFAMEHRGATRTTVEIDFIHAGKKYRASRSFEQKNGTTHELKLLELAAGGEVPTSKGSPDRFINSVIPREMAPHFFFYGEATSRYTGASGAKKFGEAVKGILGSTVARMALEDLRKAWQEYNRNASDSTSEEAKAIERDIEKADSKIVELQGELIQLDQEIDAAEGRIDKLNQELAGAKPAKEAQARRAQLEARLSTKETEKIKAVERSGKWMSEYVTSLLAEELVTEAAKVVAVEDTRGKLPAPYDQKFVTELLDDQKCVCGRPIHPGSAEHERIRSLLGTAGDQAVMSRVMTTNTALGRLETQAKRAWREFARNNEDLRKVEEDLRGIDADLTAISRELAANPLTDVKEREEARERAKQQRKKATDRKLSIQGAITSYSRERAEAEGRRNELIKKSEAARRFVKRAQLSAALMARLEGRLKAEEETARAAIEREIDAIVQKFVRKPATVKLTKDYQLQFFDDGNSVVAKSTGENQLLGLAFTGAIAKYAKERQDLDDDILLPGTVAPLVVDSPFGHLDPLYRSGVAEFLPNLASQVILLVSTSQASDAVMEKLQGSVGQEYILTRHNRGDGRGKQAEVIQIRGKTYDLTTYNSDIDGTRITEVA